MLVRDVMTRGVETIAPTDSLRTAAQKMSALDIGPLPVVEGERVVGMVTDRDITVRATAEGLDPHSTRVRDVMSTEVVSCHEDQDVGQAAQMMRDKQIRRLVVLDRQGRLAGIVALGDLAVETGDEWVAGRALEGVSRPAEPNR